MSGTGQSNLLTVRSVSASGSAAFVCCALCVACVCGLAKTAKCGP